MKPILFLLLPGVTFLAGIFWPDAASPSAVGFGTSREPGNPSGAGRTAGKLEPEAPVELTPAARIFDEDALRAKIRAFQNPNPMRFAESVQEEFELIFRQSPADALKFAAILKSDWKTGGEIPPKVGLWDLINGIAHKKPGRLEILSALEEWKDRARTGEVSHDKNQSDSIAQRAQQGYLANPTEWLRYAVDLKRRFPLETMSMWPHELGFAENWTAEEIAAISRTPGDAASRAIFNVMQGMTVEQKAAILKNTPDAPSPLNVAHLRLTSRRLAEEDLGAAFHLMEELTDPGVRSALFLGISAYGNADQASELVRTDPAAATGAMKLAALRASDTDADTFLSLADQSLSQYRGTADFNAAAQAVLLAGNERAEPILAATAATRLPPGPERADFLTQVIKGWAETDVIGASAFLADLPAADLPDSTLTALIGEIPNDPESALHWAARIGDPQKRREVTDSVLAPLREKDPQRAEVLEAQFSTVTPPSTP